MERNKRSPICKNLIPGLTERGKIKIGCKGQSRKKSDGSGTYQLPQKLDHFIVTTLERNHDGNFVKDETIHKIIGDKPKEIPVMLMFDDIALNFQCRYACYNGKTLFCSGDGEFADQLTEQKTRKEVSCPCYRHEPTYTGKDKCKINGTLSVMIQGVNHVGGIHKFRTTGYNSTVGILSSLTLIRSLTGGYLAGLPLKMTIQPKVCTSPVDGSSQTVYVVGVEFAGSLSDLQQQTLKIAQGNAEFKARMLNVENEVRKLISVDASLIDEAGDITEEFYVDEEPETLSKPAGSVTESTETPTPTETPAPAKTKGKRKSAPAETPQPEPAPDPEPEPEQIQNPVGDADFDIEM